MADERLRSKSELKRLFTNLQGKNITDEMMSIAIDSLWRDKRVLRTSGFEFPAHFDSEISFDTITRIFSIKTWDPLVENWSPRYGIYSYSDYPVFHRHFDPFEIEIPNEEGLFCIYFAPIPETGVLEIQIIKNPTEEQENNIYDTEIIICWIYWDATNSKAIYYGEERHGSEWNPQINWWAHETHNGLWLEGMELNNLPDKRINNGYDGNSDHNAQIGINQGRWAHEDITIQFLGQNIDAGIPVFWLEKVDNVIVPRMGGVTAFPVHVVGGSVMANQNGDRLTPVNNGYYFLMHYFATNCINNPIVGWMGRTQHQWIENAYFIAEDELRQIKEDILQKTWLHLGTVVFEASSYFPIAAKSRLVGLVTPEDIADLKALDRANFTKHGWEPGVFPAWYNHPEPDETPLLITVMYADGHHYYWQGDKYETSYMYEVGYSDVYGMQYGIMGANLGITSSLTPWRLDDTDKLMFGAFFWNPDQQKALYRGFNMYSYALHPNERFQRHFNKPVNHISGLEVTIHPTVLHMVNVSNGELQSVDIVAEIMHTEGASGGFGQEMQSLEASKYYLETTGGVTRWRIIDTNRANVAYYDQTNEVAYNQLDGTNWKLTPTANGEYIAMWLVASMDYFEPLKWIIGSQVSATVEEAREDNSPGTLQAMIDATEFFCLDYVVISRVIAKNIPDSPFYELIETENYDDGEFEDQVTDRHVTDMEWDEVTQTLTLKRNDNLPDLAKVLTGINGREVELQYNAGWVEWRYVGDVAWTQLYEIPIPADGEDGEDGRGIVSVTLTSTLGLVDTYTILFTDATTSTFDVTNGLVGGDGEDGEDGKGIVSVTLTSTLGLVDTYTVLFSDATTTTFDVTNGLVGGDGEDGEDGKGIVSVTLTSTLGLVDTYTVLFSDATTTTFDVTNGLVGADGEDGKGIVSVTLTSTLGLVDTYTVLFTDATTSTFDVTNGTNGTPGGPGSDGTDAFVYIAYASNATGTGWSTTPTDLLKYRAEIHSATPKTPVETDFTGATWVKYLGDDGSTNDEYTVLVSQTGTNNPALDVKENNIGAITCSRVGVGTYNFVSGGLFIQAKTVPITDIMQDQYWNLYKLNWVDVNTIQLKTYAAADISALSDNICDNTYINFKVYK